MIRIAYILGKVHSGGKKNLALEYLRHIDPQEATIDFICDADSNSAPAEEVEARGGKCHMIAPYQHIFANMRDLERLFRANNYDVVHAWNSTMNVFPLMVARRCGVPVRISESLSMANRHEWKTWLKYALRPFAPLGATHYMACGSDCGAFQFGRKAVDDGRVAVFKTVINARANAFDAELREATRERFGWRGSVVYGFIGRYMPQKNPLFIIDVFREIAARQSEARLVLIGFGGMEEAMMSRVADYGIADRVDNLGRREDIHQFYNAFDAFLLPSLYEGLPVVGLEAQASGLPIFFSTEITPEAAACPLATFTPLAEPAAHWAEKIINKTKENMSKRRSHADDVINAGFDSRSESARLLDFYRHAVELSRVNRGGKM